METESSYHRDNSDRKVEVGQDSRGGGGGKGSCTICILKVELTELLIDWVRAVEKGGERAPRNRIAVGYMGNTWRGLGVEA